MFVSRASIHIKHKKKQTQRERTGLVPLHQSIQVWLWMLYMDRYLLIRNLNQFSTKLCSVHTVISFFALLLKLAVVLQIGNPLLENPYLANKSQALNHSLSLNKFVQILLHERERENLNIHRNQSVF